MLEIIQQNPKALWLIALAAAAAWLQKDRLAKLIPKLTPKPDEPDPAPVIDVEVDDDCHNLVDAYYYLKGELGDANEKEAVTALESAVWPALGRLGEQESDEPAG